VLPEGHADLSALFDAYKWMRNNMPVAKAIVEGYGTHLAGHQARRHPGGRESVGSLCAGAAQSTPASHNPILQTQAGDEFTKQLLGGSLRILDALPYIDPPSTRMPKTWLSTISSPRRSRIGRPDPRSRQRVHRASQAAFGPREIDLVDDWALGFPLHVMMTLVGVPREDEPRMMALTQEFFGTADPEHQREDVEALSPEAMAQQFSAAIQDFFGYFDVLAEDRRAHPRDDLATVVACAKLPDGEYWPKSFVYGWYTAIFTAGHDTHLSNPGWHAEGSG